MKIRLVPRLFPIILVVTSVATLLLMVYRIVYAADGSGTMTVAPASVTASSTGNALAFTFTASETLDSGGLTLTVPSGWSAPQGTAGTAGYTIATSTLGTVATLVNNLDTTANWTATTHMTLSADTADNQQGTASLSNAITTSTVANEQWYFNYGGATNWGVTNGNTTDRIGFWLKSSVNTAVGNFSWQDDNSASLASPLDTVSLPALTADTWTYATATLAAARASQLSYGFRYTTDIGTTTFKVDSISKIFDAADATTGWSSDSNITVSLLNTDGNFKEGTGAIRCAYAAAAGIGTSGDCFDNEGAAFTTGPDAKVSFWVRSSVALSAGDFAFIDDQSSNVSSVIDSISLPALSANTWTYVTLSAPSIASTRSYGLRQLVDKGAINIDIDAIGNIINVTDSTTGWTTSSDGIQALSSDTSTFHEGSASLKNVISATAAAGDAWYETYSSPQNWSGYTTSGLWIRSTVNTAAGNLKLQYSSASDLSDPIASINIDALTANTWTYQKLTLTGTRTSIKSYGINYATDIGAATVNLDDVLIGPGSPTFPNDGIINVRILQLGNGQTIGVTYGSGDGTSGAEAPAIGRISTFTTQTRTSDSGTLTDIISSPTVTVNNPFPTTASISPTATTTGAAAFTMNVTGTGFNSSSTVKFDGNSLTTTFLSSSTLQAAILTSDLTASGTFPVVVTNPTPGGGTSNSQTFTVGNPTPSTSSLSPSSITAGSSGFTLTVNGSNFVSGAVVKFNGNSRTTSFVSASQVSASILSGDVATAGTFNVIVTNPTPGGGDSNAQVFTVVNPQPTTASISPSSKSAGDAQFTLTVTGTGFNASSLVRLNGSDRSTSFTSSSSLDAVIPASDLTTASSSILITVFNPTPGGGTSNAQVFSVNAVTPQPTINSFTAASSTIQSSQSTTLTWSTTNATSASIDQGIGSVNISGSQTVSPTATTTYTLTATGPGGTSTASVTVNVSPAPTPLPTISFSVSTSTIDSGQSTSLTWSTTNATSASIDQGIGSVGTSGTQTVSPTATTTYTLTATGAGGTATENVTVNVRPASSPLPTISFSASPSTINSGQSTTLTWSTTNATSASIDQGIGSVGTSGTQTVSPTMDTTYTITATGPGGTQTASVLITVTASAPSTPTINSFTINPASITAGESAILSWITTGSTTTTINQGIGAVSANSTVNVAPALTTTYTITAESSGGTQTASVALTVLPAASQSAPALSIIKPSTANFSGRAFPGAQVTLMEKLYEQNIILGQGIPVSDAGNFTLWGIPTGYHAYGLVVKDKNGRSTAIKLFDREFINDSFAIANILMSPTIEVMPTAVTKGQTITVVGSAFPGSGVEVNFDNTKTLKTTADDSGAYTLEVDTSNLALGIHTVRSKQTTPDGQTSDYSLTRTFSVSATTIVKADFNNDGIIDIKDWSIFLSNWKQTTPQAKQLIDLNGDGKVDISDVSIFLKTFKK